jgi:NAD(P)-dependent dehydrogenase (short-subunit alcohol dehydrogenase family)
MEFGLRAGPFVAHLNQPQGRLSMGVLESQVAIITGGASGMGRSTVHRYCREGARVVVADMNEENGAKVLLEAKEYGFGDNVRFVRTDVSQEDQIERVVEVALNEFGALDIMFNNAGVGGAFGAIDRIHVEDWDYTFAVNTRGAFLGIKHAARAMKAAGRGGCIINTASVAGLGGGGGPTAYSASKAAVINLTTLSAVELAPFRIRVNSILPGGILTPLVHGGREEKVAAEMDTMQPWPEHGVGDDIAGAAVYLASPDARYVTGIYITVDGGLVAQGPSVGTKLSGPMKTRPDRVGVNRGMTGEPTLFHEGAPVPKSN